MGGVKYTAELLQPAVDNSRSFAGVLRYLDLKPSGSMQSHIIKRCRDLGLDTSHFLSQGWASGKQSRRRKTPDQILVVLPPGSARPKITQIVRALLESGVKHQCSLCSNTGVWLGKPMTLEVDHIDGDWLNNLLDNLRFLCPNCHSQQETNRSWKNSMVT